MKIGKFLNSRREGIMNVGFVLVGIGAIVWGFFYNSWTLVFIGIPLCILFVAGPVREIDRSRVLSVFLAIALFSGLLGALLVIVPLAMRISSMKDIYAEVALGIYALAIILAWVLQGVRRFSFELRRER
ncbi:MAG: hypothetical protein ABIJ36_02600 [Patescibacteria group bacterium]|nr:hypothetical protein [Patescibacteria group bacterium]